MRACVGAFPERLNPQMALYHEERRSCSNCIQLVERKVFAFVHRILNPVQAHHSCWSAGCDGACVLFGWNDILLA
jgi:hypothetical protein